MLLFGAEVVKAHDFIPTEEVSEIGWFTSAHIMAMAEEGRLRSPDMVKSALSRMESMSKLEYACGLRPIIRVPKSPRKSE